MTIKAHAPILLEGVREETGRIEERDCWSEGLQSLERRRYARLNHSSPVKGWWGSWYWRHRLRGGVLNLSSTGLALQLKGGRPPLPGAAVRLRLSLSPPPCAAGGSKQGLPCTVTGTVMWSRASRQTGHLLCGIRLNELIQESLERAAWGWQRTLTLVIALCLLGLIGLLKFSNVRWFWYDTVFQLYSLVVAVFIFSRALLSLFYRLPKDQGFLPSVSVVIAVKNEEAHIAETVKRCRQSRYPADRLEILIVDDGSTDGTWTVLTALAADYPALRVFRFPENLGKRHAMALGAEEARGEILVYIDSDSVVEPEGIYRIAQGFADPRVGAVAGHVRVIVEPGNVISKMESVRYFVSHRVMKAAESVFGCVTCCSGAFSAYRRSAVMASLPQWLNQTFLGAQATFGDDRSLTNFVLRTYRVIYCHTARAWTYVPDTWSKYFRQQLRWKKSWSRETLIASRILSRKPPLAAISYYMGVGLTVLAPLMVIRNMLVLPLVYSMSSLPYVIGLGLVYLFFCCVYAYGTHSRYWVYGMAFAGLYIGVLCWQNYYAMATVSRSHWGTR